MEKKVKIGDRIELLFINDTWTKLQKGARGTIIKIEDDGGEKLIWVNWENGEQLALLQGIDKYKIIT